MDRIERINEMLKQTPNDSFLLFALGLEEIKKGNDDAALQHFIVITETNENYSGVYYHLGKMYERKNNIDKAIETYEKGMMICKKLNEQHNFNELRNALDMIL